MRFPVKSCHSIVPRLSAPIVVARGGLKRLMPRLLLAASFAFAPWPVLAQGMLSDEMQQMQAESNVDRNLLVSNVMQLTDAEAKNFWPVYEAYLENLEQLNRNFADIIQGYAFALRSNSLTEDVAKQLTDQFLAAQEGEIKLRKSYAANLAKVVPGKTVARALQLENKIRAVAWYGLASQIPLVRQ
jgi:hypothetical protein